MPASASPNSSPMARLRVRLGDDLVLGTSAQSIIAILLDEIPAEAVLGGDVLDRSDRGGAGDLEIAWNGYRGHVAPGEVPPKATDGALGHAPAHLASPL